MSTAFVLRRLLQVIPTVLGIVLVAFLLIHLAPGDPVLALAGEHGDASYYNFMRQRFGLDQSLLHQLGTYFARVAAGDLGVSYVHGRTTVSVIMERAPATLLLTGTALVIAVVLSIPLGAYAARRPHGARDNAISAGALAVYSAPAFWLAQVAIIVIAVQLDLLPVQGMTEAGASSTGLRRALDIAKHLALPALVLASQEIAVLARLTRSSLVDELARDHIRTARAKGLSEKTILTRHAMPRALLPTITVIGARTGHLIAGAVVVEIVFGWPGIGRLLVSSLQARNTPVLLGLFMLVSITVILANLVSDLVHAAIDPRIGLD
ncbi:MAG TPA: ABC transporter permease [Gemmatimonadaceae bacterium]|nr:ABC transporter permease [Gemmatimonadaceae bacterium]